MWVGVWLGVGRSMAKCRGMDSSRSRGRRKGVAAHGWLLGTWGANQTPCAVRILMHSLTVFQTMYCDATKIATPRHLPLNSFLFLVMFARDNAPCLAHQRGVDTMTSTVRKAGKVPHQMCWFMGNAR